MLTPGQFLRLLSIQRVLIHHRLDEIILATHLFRPLRFLLYLLPWNWIRRPPATRGERILHALEDLGPIFVKFGQLLSTRRDLIPDDIADALARLRDRVPPFPGTEAREIIEAAYGGPLSEIFSEFEEQPLASASIAQVHAARLQNGREVVVKVVRPGIKKLIRRDLSLLYIAAELSERYWQDGRRLRPVRLVAEFEKTILDELDMIREAANASQLRRNFRGSLEFYVPAIEWELIRREVMVMERVCGIPIDDLKALQAAGIDLRQLARIGIEIFFTQVFRDQFFHADMHPGNLFVLPSDNLHPLRIVPVDFGIMGSVSDIDQRYLADNILAFLKRDYRRVAELHVESGWVPEGTRVDEFESAIRTVCEPMFERPLRDISFGHLLLRLLQTAQRFHMEILPQFILLQKTLINIEGLGRQLCPDLDLWHTARPALEHWMGERVGVGRLVETTWQNVPKWAERLPELPGTILEVFDKAKAARFTADVRISELNELHRVIRGATQRLVLAIVGIGFVISASVLLGLDDRAPAMLGKASYMVWVLGGLGAMILVGVLAEK